MAVDVGSACRAGLPAWPLTVWPSAVEATADDEVAVVELSVLVVVLEPELCSPCAALMGPRPRPVPAVVLPTPEVATAPTLALDWSPTAEDDVLVVVLVVVVVDLARPPVAPTAEKEEEEGVEADEPA